jgi:protein-arginine deiminase
MLYHHLLDAEVAYVAANSGQSSVDFRADFLAGIEAAGNKTEYFEMQVGDQWNQDYFETGYMSMPIEGGGQHAIRVNFRSANVDNPNNPDNPLRPAGQVVFSYLRGIDSAPIQEYDLSHPGQMDSLDSFGNTETIPPYTYNGESYPLGRIFRGNLPSFYPDPKFTKMLEDQKIQTPLYVDTSWLLVGHVDETTSFVPADTELGWKLVMNDAQMAIDMFEDLSNQGYGDVVLFEGKEWQAGVSAEVTIDDVLDDEDVMGESLASAAEVDDQVAIIKSATGLTEDDIIRIPYLHWTMSGYSVAYQPGTVNGILIDSDNFMPPKPHGPKIEGKDAMEKQFEEAYSTVGMNVRWVEDWDLYHRLLGEVHCGSNATREIPEVKWWETGR